MKKPQATVAHTDHPSLGKAGRSRSRCYGAVDMSYAASRDDEGRTQKGDNEKGINQKRATPSGPRRISALKDLRTVLESRALISQARKQAQGGEDVRARPRGQGWTRAS